MTGNKRNASAMDERTNPVRTRILHDQRGPVILGSLGVALSVTILFWPVANKPMLLLIWLLANIALAAVRWRVSNGYINSTREKQDQQHKYWATWFTIGSFVNGVLWGSVPFIFLTQELHHLAFMMCVHAGYVGAASSATSVYYLKSFYAFALPATLLFVIAIIMHGGQGWFAYAFLLVFYLAPTSFAARSNNRSLTEQIKLQLENTELLADLRDQRDRAEHAMMAKNRFLAAASHDLRQPVHALGLFAGSLESHLEKDEPKRILNKIKQSTAALGGLFHGLLDISKLDANVVENFPQHLALDELLEPIRAEFEETAKHKGLQLAIPTRTGHVAYVDPALLERILRNIVSNAVNYTDEGSVSLSIDLNDDNQLEISITDTGKGIPGNELDNIFSEYHQLENPERDRQKGLGLGLAIVNRLCSLMDINIAVSSRVGEGSVFTLKLPAGEHSQVVDPVTVDIAGENKSCQRTRVVVVDDEVDILEGMESLLNDWGCHTVSATSTSNALVALTDEETPDIIIADFRLRNNESGLDTIRSIRDEFNTDIPALLVTGDTAPERLQQAAAASVQVMHKPVEPGKLKAMLHQLITPELVH